jgi:uncharacterized protein YecE (DUF72 family)
MGQLYIGTSGWNYKHWRDGVFYPPRLPAGRWLEHYAGVFNSVELNVTFYRSVPRTTFEGWRRGTPEEFRFVAKGPRFITHLKRLKVERESVDYFLKSAGGLGEKLSAVLWQLPPRFRKDLGRLERFLEMSDDGRTRRVFEFRDESWFDEEVFELLRRHGVCLCTAHSARRPLSLPGKTVREITSDFLYLRFHGGRDPSSEYSHEELVEWAAFARRFRTGDLYAFFNNDARGFAVKNALEFRELFEPSRRHASAGARSR